MGKHFNQPGEQHVQKGVMDIVSDKYGVFLRQDKETDLGTIHYNFNGDESGITIDGVDYDRSGNRIYD